MVTRIKVFRALLGIVCGLLLSGAQASMAEDSILTAQTPVPNAELMEAVISIDYPQQTRMNAMTRVTEQTTAETVAERADWFAAIVKSDSAPSVIRGHALDQIFLLKYEPAGLVAWIMTAVGNQSTTTDWRLSCIARMDGVYNLAQGNERNGIPAQLNGIIGTETGLATGAALLTLAKLSEQVEDAGVFAMAAVNQILSAPAGDPELVLSAVQAAVILNNDSVVATVRSIALDPAQGLRLRMAATGALGEIGTADDAATITQVRASSPILRKVSDNALARLRSRLGI